MKLHTRILFLAICAVALGACVGPDNYVDVTTMEELPDDPYVYTITPGDVVQVEIAEDDEYEWETTVLPDGSATFRWAGDIEVMGLTLQETRDKLRTRLKDYYNDPTMTLYLKRINGPKPIVYIGNFGGVATAGSVPQRSGGGTIPYRKGIGVVEAIALAGGPGEPDVDVAPYVYIVRNMQSIHDRVVFRFDLAEAVRGGSPDLPLHPGDTVFLDQSWLQDLERALGIYARVVGTTTSGLGAALLIDSVADGGLTD